MDDVIEELADLIRELTEELEGYENSEVVRHLSTHIQQKIQNGSPLD